MKKLVIAILLLLTLAAACEGGTIQVEVIPPTPTTTPGANDEAGSPPASLSPQDPLEDSFSLGPDQTDTFDLVLDEAGSLVLTVQLNADEGDVELGVSVPDGDANFIQQLEDAGLPQVLLEEIVSSAEGEFDVQVGPEYAGHTLRVTLHNTGDAEVEGEFTASLEAAAPTATPTPEQLEPTATSVPPTATPTPEPTATSTPSATPTATPRSSFDLEVSIQPEEAAQLGAVVSGSGTHEAGSTVNMGARRQTRCQETSRYVFDHWEGASGIPDSNPASVVMNEDKVVVAVYVLEENAPACQPTPTPTPTATPTPVIVTLRVSAINPPPVGVTFQVSYNGTTQNRSIGGTVQVRKGTTVTIVADPPTFCQNINPDPFIRQQILWALAGWQGVDSSSGQKAVVTVDDPNTTVTAAYHPRAGFRIC